MATTSIRLTAVSALAAAAAIALAPIATAEPTSEIGTPTNSGSNLRGLATDVAADPAAQDLLKVVTQNESALSQPPSVLQPKQVSLPKQGPSENWNLGDAWKLGSTSPSTSPTVPGAGVKIFDTLFELLKKLPILSKLVG